MRRPKWISKRSDESDDPARCFVVHTPSQYAVLALTRDELLELVAEAQALLSQP